MENQVEAITSSSHDQRANEIHDNNIGVLSLAEAVINKGMEASLDINTESNDNSGAGGTADDARSARVDGNMTNIEKTITHTQSLICKGDIDNISDHRATQKEKKKKKSKLKLKMSSVLSRAHVPEFDHIWEVCLDSFIIKYNITNPPYSDKTFPKNSFKIIYKNQKKPLSPALTQSDSKILNQPASISLTRSDLVMLNLPDSAGSTSANQPDTTAANQTSPIAPNQADSIAPNQTDLVVPNQPNQSGVAQIEPNIPVNDKPLMANNLFKFLNEHPSIKGLNLNVEKLSKTIHENLKQLQLREVMIASSHGKITRAKEFVDNPNSKYNKLLASLRSKRAKFVDTEFPPHEFSLGISDTFNAKEIIWCRPDQFYGVGKYKMYEGGVSSDDIKQGQLGDCYFLCVLAALAEWPHRIEKLFVNKEINDEGCYAIRINDLGEWQEVIVDDYFPCWIDDKTLSFARGHGCEMWVILLEKAWAKLFGSYSRIEAGVATEALRNLTGAPTKFFYLADLKDNGRDDLWKEIVEGSNKNFVMACSSPSEPGLTDKDDRDGIYWGHAYSILSAHEIHNHDQKVKLLRIRNPHSYGEWTGAWSDESILWTEEAKTQVKWCDEDDGTFFMSWEDFFEYFEDIQICKVYDDYHYNSFRIENIKHLEKIYFKIHINQPGHYYITINQENTRHYPESQHYEEGQIFMSLVKDTIHDKILTFKEIDRKYLARREIWVQHTRLDIGEYWIFVRPEWCDNKCHPLVLSSYGPTDTIMMRMNENECKEFADFTNKYKFE